MRSINNKYLIENEIDVEENFSYCLVKDTERNKKYILYILKNNFTYEKTQEYLLTKFKTIKNLNFKNVINLIDIQIIYSIDGIKLTKPLYGYLTEFTDNINKNIEHELEKYTIEEKLNIFMKICEAVNTLNIKGYIFNEISLKDIIFIKNNNEIQVKIKNLLEYEINKFRISNLGAKNMLPYPYNVENEDETYIYKDNIFQIIFIFNQLFTKDNIENFKELSNIKNICSNILTFNKPYRLSELIKYISNQFNKKYKKFDYDALNKIDTDLDIIGMENELEKVEKAFQEILENKKNYKIIGFNGHNGCGKSRLLEEIKYNIDKKYFKNIIHLKNFKNENLDKNKLYNNILDYIFSKLNKRLKDKYEIYIRKFIDICLEDDESYNKNLDKQRLQLINRISKLLSEFTVYEPLIILIDDLEEANCTIKLFIRYISFLENNLENVMIIFSMNEIKCNSDFLELIKELRAINEYNEYKINYLNQYNTTNMIKSMLNRSKSINKLAIKIYSETLGNPKFIKGVIRELYDNKIIYLSKNTGEWKTKVNINNIIIPKTLEKSLESSIDCLSKDEIKALNKLSIIENPLSEKILLDYLFVEPLEKKCYKSLKEKGLLIEKISDSGLLVDFSNILLKNTLYLRLNNDERINMHMKACVFLEEILFEIEYYVDELLMHLEKCHKFDKIYFYSIRCAKIADIQGNTLKAIGYYKKALKYSAGENRGKAALNIAKLYKRIDEEEKAYKYFILANEISVEVGCNTLTIDSIVEIIIIKINENNNMDLQYPLKVVEDLLKETSHSLGQVYYHYALGLELFSNNEFEAALINGIKAINICKENKINDNIEGWIKVLISDIHKIKNNFEESKILLDSANEIFIKENITNGIIIVKLKMAYLSKKEEIKGIDIINQYLDINRLSIKYKMYRKEILSLTLIGEFYIKEKKYKEAEKYLLHGLEREREEGIDLYSAKICNYLYLLHFYLGNIKYAIKYYKMTKQLYNTVRPSETDLINFGFAAVLYNSFICDYNEAIENLDNIYDLINYKHDNYNNMMCKYYELMLYRCKRQAQVKVLYNKLKNILKEVKDNNIIVEVKLNAIRIILELGYDELAKNLFGELDFYPKNHDVEAKYVYLEIKFRSNNSWNILINKALRVCTFVNNEKIKADIYSAIGEAYNKLNCHTLELNYYYESICLHIEIINLLSNKDKISYINNSGFLNLRNLFFECLAEDFNIKTKSTSLNSVEDEKIADKIIKELKLENLFRNNKILKIAEELYEKTYYNDYNNIEKILQEFNNDNIKNLEYLLKYMARITLSNKAILVIENNEGDNEVVCSYRIKDKDELNKYFSLKIDQGEDTLVICNNDNRIYELDEDVLKNEVKSCIYAKIRSKNRMQSNGILMNAKLILISDSAINYINYESKKLIEKFKPLLVLFLEQYNLKINSTLDKLTGVYNRKYFENFLIELIETSNSDRSEFAIIMFDVDNFKYVNDKYGHQKGDEVLSKLANIVKETISKDDIIGRYGGEEFIVILPKTDRGKAFIIAEEIRSNVEKAKILGDKMKITISLGLAMYTMDHITYEEIIDRADQALYTAKFSGKNRCEIWEYTCGENSTSSDITGVLSTNIVRDYNLILVIRDILDLVRYKLPLEDKIYQFMMILMKSIECDTATVFFIKNNKVSSIYSKKQGEEGWDNCQTFNNKILYEVIENKKGIYAVDWELMYNDNPYGIPEWKSVCVYPIICNGEIIAILYLDISVNKKEFNINDYNILKCFGGVGTPIFY